MLPPVLAMSYAPAMKITAYLVAAMLSWSPAKDHAPDTEAETTARYTAIADDIAAVVQDSSEGAIFKDDPAKARTALQLAGVAFFESRFWSYVDTGKCNDREWRAKQPTSTSLCDGGLAWSLWQIHTRFTNGRAAVLDGIALDGDGWKHDSSGFVGKQLLADRKLAARVALHMLRASLARGGTLCGYTGETGPCPKAVARLSLAKAYLAKHPFTPDTEGATASR